MTREGRGALLALAGVTILAFALRVPGMDQTLYGDEYFSFRIVTENGLRGVWSEVYNTSITPPLHYGLAWLAIHLPGDDTVLVRLPSLILGTATVPLVYLLGRRVASARAGLVAATLLALSPFAIWYADEARAYSTMMFLVVLSSLALLRALAGGERRGWWWTLYALSACGALWSHYTSAFVLLAQALWALWSHREQWRALAIASGVAALGYLPWLPGFLEQRKNDVGIEIIEVFSKLSVGRVFSVPLTTLVGHPFLKLRESPGRLGLALILVLLLLAALALYRRPASFRELLPSARSPPFLILLLSLATPIGLLLYSLAGSSLYLPRNLAASLPALVVLAGILLDVLMGAVPRRFALGAAIALLALLAVMAVDIVVDEDDRRPAYREAANYLDRVAASEDPVVDTPLTAANDPRFLTTTLGFYADRPHPIYATGAGDVEAWRQLDQGRTVYLVAPDELAPRQYLDSVASRESVPPGLVARLTRLGGPDGRAILRGRRTFPGIFRISVFRYRGRVSGRIAGRRGSELITWSFGRRIKVKPGVARGEALTSPAPQPLTVAGWALRSERPDLVDWVLIFAGRRLLAVSAGGVPRPDITAKYGPSALLSGFARRPVDAVADRARVRVFAVVGGRASELPQP